MASLYELGSAPQAEGGRGKRRTGAFGIIIIIATLIAGLCAVGGGVAEIRALAARHPTSAQIAAAGQREFGMLWERMSAGQIFPATAGYLNTQGFNITATRVGIAPPAPCGATVDAKAARVLAAAGCVTMLRATYADTSGTVVATVGIAVTRSSHDASKVLDALSAGSSELLPVSFPGTMASAFTVRARETGAVVTTSGRYVYLYAAGYADGRSTKVHPAPDIVGFVATEGETATTDLGTGIVTDLAPEFRAPVYPCKDRNIKC